MADPDRPADQIRKLVAMADPGKVGPAEAAVARTKARKAIASLNVELLSTLEGQRKGLLENLRDEHRRLISSRERATKAETGELVGSAMMLFQHYERQDALIAAVLLLRIEDGHALTDAERQQLEGPVDDFISRWSRARREERKAEREQRRAERRQQHEREVGRER